MTTERNTIRTLLTLFLILAFCPIAQAAPNKKMEFLIRFFDANETAFAYHRHCLSQRKGIDTKFLATLELVADTLFVELQKASPKMKPEYLQSQILQRRYNIQYGLDRQNIQNGCYNQATQTAKKHYEEFSQYDKAEILKFINDKTAE